MAHILSLRKILSYPYILTFLLFNTIKDLTSGVVCKCHGKLCNRSYFVEYATHLNVRTSDNILILPIAKKKLDLLIAQDPSKSLCVKQTFILKEEMINFIDRLDSKKNEHGDLDIALITLE